MTNQYQREIAKAKDEYADYLERGEEAVAEDDWDAYKLKHCTPEEVAASKMWVAKVGRKIAARDRRRKALRHIAIAIGLILPAKRERV